MFKIIDKNKITVSGNKLTYTPSFNNNHIKVIRSVLLFDTTLLEQVANLEVKINDLIVDNIKIDSNNKKEKICIDITDELNDVLRNGNNSLIVTFSNLTEISTDASNYEVITNYILTKELQNNTYQDVSVKRAGNGKINLSTGELKFIHSDLNLGSNILDMNVSHIYNTFNKNSSIDKVCTKSSEIELPKSYTGKGWKLSTEQYLVKERPNNELLDEDVSANYTYVNADGNHILFQEKYYYEKDDEKLYLSPNMIYVDDNGNLKYREDTINYDVKSEIITNSDYVLIPKAEGFNDLKKIEQDTNEIATLRDQIEAYKDEINNLDDEINNTAEKIEELEKIIAKYDLNDDNFIKFNDTINSISQELQNVNYYIQKKTSDNDVNTKTLQKNYNNAQINYLLAHISFAPDAELESKSKSVSSYQKDIILNENNFKIGNYNYTPINYEDMSIIDLQAKQVDLQEKYNILLEKYYEDYLVKLNNKKNNYTQKLKKLVYQINNYIKQVPEIYISNKEGSLVLGFAKFKNNSLYTSDGIIIANENETYRLVTIFDNYENAIYLNYEDDYDNQEYKLSSVVSDDGNTVSLKYYDNGMLQEISGDNGQKLKFQYKTDTQTGDILEYLESIIYPDETISKYEYDNDGRLIKVIDNNDYYIKFDYLENRIKLIEGTKYKTITGVGDSILNSNDDGTLENIERELLDIELYDYKMTKLKDRLGNTRTYLFDNTGKAVTIYDGEFNEINPSQTKISSITQEYKDNTKARSVQKIGTSKNLLNMYSDNYISNTTYLSQQLFATFYEKSADTNIYQVNSSNNKKEVTTNNVLVNILNSGTKGYVFSAFAKADAAFTADSSMVNFEGLDKIIIDNIDELKLTRRFGLKAELTYTDNSQEVLETSFDWMQTEWQYAELPIVIDENKTLSEIKLCFDYTNNIGTAKVYGFDLKEAIIEESIFNDKKQLISKTNSLLDTITTYEYDNNLLVKSTLSHNGNTYTNRYTYNTQGLPIKSVDYNGNVQENEYNDKGKLVKTIKYNVNDPTTKFISETKLDEKGREISLVDEFGRDSVSYEYSKNSGLLTAEKDQNGNKLCYGYDPLNGTLTGIGLAADGDNNSNTFGYTLGHLTTLTHNDFNINFEYNGFGEPLAVKIDGVDGDYARFTKVSDTDELVTYATGESMETITDSKGNVTRVNYTDKDAVRTTILKNTYNSEDNLINQEENIDGNKFLYEYDYDNYGNQTMMKKSKVSSENDTETLNQEILVESSFDIFGNLSETTTKFLDDATTSISDINEGAELKATYTYTNTLEQKIESIDFKNIYNTYNTYKTTKTFSQKQQFDKLGRLKDLTINNTSGELVSENYSYLKLGEHSSNLISSIWYGKKGAIKNSLKYVYDNKGNIFKVLENGIELARYFYDENSRLIREDNKKLDKTFFYEYDRGGNIVRKISYKYNINNREAITTAATTYNYEYPTSGWKDQMLSFNGLACEYDELGNPTKYKGKNLTWDNLRTLKTYDNVSFTYDKNGIRTSKTITTTETDDEGVVTTTVVTKKFYLNGNKIIMKDNVSNYLHKIKQKK